MVKLVEFTHVTVNHGSAHARGDQIWPGAPVESRVDKAVTKVIAPTSMRPPIKTATHLVTNTDLASAFPAQHCLYFLPLPHGHGSLRPVFATFIAFESILFQWNAFILNFKLRNQIQMDKTSNN